MPYFKTEVIEIIERSKAVRSFRFKDVETEDFEAGQFFLLTLQVDGQDVVKPFSFSNSPTEKGYIEFTKKLTDSPFSRALSKLKVGDQISIKMPFGDFSLDKNDKKVVFIAGGIGITPFRSVVKYATDAGMTNDIVLLYGNDAEQNITFKQDLDVLQDENINFRVVYTLSDPDVKTCGWKGCCGYIDSGMIKTEVPDYKDRVFYLCGPPGMVKCIDGGLKTDLGIPEGNIRREHFIGYDWSTEIKE